MNSNFGKLNILDYLKGFLMAIAAALVAALNNIFVNNIPIEFTWVFWQPVVYSALGMGILYLLKNVFQNSDGVPFKGDIK